MFKPVLTLVAGLAAALPATAMAHPRLVTASPAQDAAVSGPTSLSLMRDIYFSPVTRPEELLDFAHLIQPESVRAISDMLVAGIRRHRPRPQLPVMVIGGERDAVFPPFATSHTALRWRARETYIPDCGHMLMLEHKWQEAAGTVARWLERPVRRRPPARSSGSSAAA